MQIEEESDDVKDDAKKNMVLHIESHEVRQTHPKDTVKSQSTAAAPSAAATFTADGGAGVDSGNADDGDNAAVATDAATGGGAAPRRAPVVHGRGLGRGRGGKRTDESDSDEVEKEAEVERGFPKRDADAIRARSSRQTHVCAKNDGGCGEPSSECACGLNKNQDDGRGYGGNRGVTHGEIECATDDGDLQYDWLYRTIYAKSHSIELYIYFLIVDRAEKILNVVC